MFSVLAVLLAAAANAQCQAHVVTHAKVAYKHHTTIQSAIDAAKACDWVLIAPGVYPEKVVIKTPNLHLRGMNRNKVIVDGRHQAGNGILVDKASGVWIENLTVRNFDRATRDGEDGNEIWWNGGDESGEIGAQGWWGNYLTVYDTGLLGGYGLFTANMVQGGWNHVYASGFNDSGLYIGACRDCQAYVRHALVERNALGYSGTNSGGHLVIENSVFRNNAVGIGPNSLPNDKPPPQLGTCDSGLNTSPTPTIATTKVLRCTIIRNNQVINNNLQTAPTNSSTASLPWGVGIALVGTYGDWVMKNTVTGNRNFGIVGFENPVPYPPTDKTLYFQFSGNRIDANTVSGSSYADIAFEGGLFGSKQSVNNCFASNTAKKTMPADLSPWSCDLATTPNADSVTSGTMLGLILKLQDENRKHVQKGQPAPKAKPTMPNPCRGAPRNPLCS